MTLEKLFQLAVACVLLPAAVLAQDKERFMEFRAGTSTVSFDMNTVQVLVPGRFAILATSLDDAELIKLRLAALETTKTYCDKQPGKYAAPKSALVLGEPDKPVEKIEVSVTDGKKVVVWQLPYTLAGQMPSFFNCSRPNWYLQSRNSIMNGHKTKYVFDCKRAIAGLTIDASDPPEEALTHEVFPETNLERWYTFLCYRVNKELPTEAKKRKG